MRFSALIKVRINWIRLVATHLNQTCSEDVFLLFPTFSFNFLFPDQNLLICVTSKFEAFNKPTTKCAYVRLRALSCATIKHLHYACV